MRAEGLHLLTPLFKKRGGGTRIYPMRNEGFLKTQNEHPYLKGGDDSKRSNYTPYKKGRLYSQTGRGRFQQKQGSHIFVDRNID